MRLEVRPHLPATRSRPMRAAPSLAAMLLLAFALVACAGTVEAPVRADVPGQAAARPDAAMGLRGPVPARPETATPVTAQVLQAAGIVPATAAEATPAASRTPAPAPCTDAAAAAGAETAVYASSDDGYCVRYPAKMKAVVGGGQAHTVIFNGPGRDTNGQEVQVSLLVEVKPAAGETLDQIVEGVLASYPPDVAQGTVRQDARIGGQPAAVLEGLPGQLANRQAFVIQEDRLYHLVLSPFREPSMPELQAEAQAAWDAATESLTFLP